MIKVDTRSLTVRLTVLFAVASIGVLVLMGTIFYASLRLHFLHQDAIELSGKRELVRNLASRLQDPADLESVKGRLEDALVGHRNLQMILQRPDGAIVFSNLNGVVDFHGLGQTRGSVASAHGMSVHSLSLGGHDFRLIRFEAPTATPDAGTLRATLVMNVDHHKEFMVNVRGAVVFGVLVGAGAAALLGWLVARVGLTPVRELAALTARISADRLAERVPFDGLPSELKQLAQSFNAMLDRLQDSFGRLKEFSSDLAHELRTPISALMTQSQVALSRSRSADDYREVIYSAMEEYDRLARMITDMLFLAKSDNGLLIPAREQVDLRAEVLALFEFYDAFGEAKRVTLEVDGGGSVCGDRIMVRRALSNLLSNAIRHGEPGTAVRVQIQQMAQGGCSLEVTNAGETIPAEHLPRLFDRFYRVDRSRQRSSEGSGLGLAITRSIIVAHGGTIAASSTGGTTRFEVHLPNAA